MVSPISYGSSYTASNCSNVESFLVVDQLGAILNVERKYMVHQPLYESVSERSEVYPYSEWRRKICQWSFKVIDYFKLDREVVSRAMNILDRYWAERRNKFDTEERAPICGRHIQIFDSRTFQLIAVTSLYLTIKLSDNEDDHYSSSKKLRLSSFVELSRGQFSAEEISDTERCILHELRWEVFPPTPMTSVSYLLSLIPSQEKSPFTCDGNYNLVLHVLHELARYLTELSVCDDRICTSNTSSQIAYASIILSMEVLTFSALPQNVRESFHEAVHSISVQSEGTILSSQSDEIRHLQDALRESFWPEILVEDCEHSDVGHPISMAKDFGLLEITHLVPQQCRMASDSSMVRNRSLSTTTATKEIDLRDSPVCVNGHYR